jgi:plastocyanin
MAAIVWAGCAVLLLVAATEQPPVRVTQKGREFHPLTLTLQQGQTLEIVNDDGELIHHAYVSSDSFSFDSGDQEPGTKTDVVFSVRGHFTVLCGIHPKMHLGVDVR